MAAATTTDRTLLAAAHRFLRSAEEDRQLLSQGGDAAHGVKLAQRYDAGLNKEFCLADLSRLPQLGLRWRTEGEVRSGKGGSFCGVLGCTAVDGLLAYELPFSYRDAGAPAAQVALVKLLCCGTCAGKAFRQG